MTLTKPCSLQREHYFVNRASKRERQLVGEVDRRSDVLPMSSPSPMDKVAGMVRDNAASPTFLPLTEREMLAGLPTSFGLVLLDRAAFGDETLSSGEATRRASGRRPPYSCFLVRRGRAGGRTTLPDDQCRGRLRAGAAGTRLPEPDRFLRGKRARPG